MNQYNISALKDLDFAILNIYTKEKLCAPGFHLIQERGRPGHGFLYVMDGEGLYILEDKKELVVKKHDIVYMPKHSIYESTGSISNCYSYIIVNMDIIDNTKSDLVFTNDISIILNSSNSYYKNIFQEINNSYRTVGMASDIKCKALVYEMLHHLTLDIFKNELATNNYSKIYPAILYIEEHYRENVKLDDLANVSHLSVSHFRRLFNEYFDISPLKYINKLKIKKASELLSSGLYTVSEVAEETGFSNVYYFSRLFKEITGVSPRHMME
ncbi:MAG: helix-turn-helix transcriptional regulator [Clostridiales bacterium]|nr:helix-turn-helix transcriptional regulator [Clostridiales bacterium]